MAHDKRIEPDLHLPAARASGGTVSVRHGRNSLPPARNRVDPVPPFRAADWVTNWTLCESTGHRSSNRMADRFTQFTAILALVSFWKYDATCNSTCHCRWRTLLLSIGICPKSEHYLRLHGRPGPVGRASFGAPPCPHPAPGPTDRPRCLSGKFFYDHTRL